MKMNSCDKNKNRKEFEGGEIGKKAPAKIAQIGFGKILTRRKRF